MADVYWPMGSKRGNKIIATNPGVQNFLREITFEMASHASVLLVQHRAEGHASIETDHGDVDWYVVLTDERGEKAAMSIEFGREESEIEVYDAVLGRKVPRKLGATQGLYILHDVTQLPRRSKRRVKL
ncbi:hypothetical protein M2302_002234 [Micromonospora sp. A200]|uniref:DUF5403 family protein n=1 Tax=Micromonospora sp. A200 TaxID=2940568 RepID=UPI0024765801|nr:DUF5403 family protein [Micromonospora sp. A200]MDH6462059.1 hypothetical protein [Micromonospora sp. A200]